jgi:hypothetical protein
MTELDNSQPDIFLSHAPDDAALAEAVRERFRATGLSTYSVMIPLNNPDEYIEAMRSSMTHCRVFVTIVSKSFGQAQIQLIELGVARAAQLPIYLLLNTVRPAEVPDYLSQHNRIRLWEDFPKLLKVIRKLPERQPT